MLGVVGLIVLVFIGYMIYRGKTSAITEPVTITDEQRAKVESQIAEIQGRLKSCDEASDDNKCSQFYLQLGLNYESLGQISWALDAYEGAAEADDKNYVPYSNIGSIYRRLKDFAKAEEVFKKALSIHPNNPNIYTKLFELYYYDQRKAPHEVQPLFLQAVRDTNGDLNMVRLYAFYSETINDPAVAADLWKLILEQDKNLSQADKDKINKKIADLTKSAKEQGLIE